MVIGALIDHHAGCSEQKRVAIGRGTRHDRRRDISAGSRAVLNHDRLAPAGLQAVGNEARNDSTGPPAAKPTTMPTR